MMRASARPGMRAAVLALVALGVLSAALPAAAQFKVVGPDGRVTFTDRPPPAVAGQTEAVQPRTGGQDASTANTALPYDLRQVASRFPVTLYTGASCAPCDSGRALLQQRGVPYTERTVGTDQDVEALRRLTGSAEIPVLRIGQQVLRGFGREDWGSYLDAAGYPQASQLPRAYQRPAATPLVEVATVTPAPAEAPAEAGPQEVQPVPPPIPARGNAPPGFRF